MGTLTVKEISNLQERQEFLSHLLNDITALEIMMEIDIFEKGVYRIGAEQELCIVDNNFRPSKNALKILSNIKDSHFTTEIALFNLEINLDPVLLGDNCFSSLRGQLQYLLDIAHTEAKKIEKNKIILTGILPTLKKKDLKFDNITPFDRYLTLNKTLKKIRGNDFRLHIKGVNELFVTSKSILFEACNTSFQIHLQIDLKDIVDQYNWAQAIAGPVMAATTNSPLLIGRELWSETRIALFQQSVDLRNRSYHLREQKARVSFGSGWIKESILELYKDDIARYTPILTSDFDEDSLNVLQKNKIPKLEALNLFNGTLYKWNRLCYGITNGVPHFRIENRYIPSGPTIDDEIANTVFWIGIMQGLPDKYKSIFNKMSFEDARGNFINAARTGINTYFIWFEKVISAKDLILNELIPIAKNGLKKSNIAKNDIKKYLRIIEKRVEKGQTGSVWITKSNRILKNSMTRDVASSTLTMCMYKNQQKCIPVHEWKLAKANECIHLDLKRNKLGKIMTTEVFVVNENDLVALVAKIMQWKNIHHIPIVDDENKIIGIITKSDIDKIDLTKNNILVVKDIMIKNLISVDSEISLDEANRLMITNKIGCLPVIDNDDLIGIITKKDLEKFFNAASDD
ncbi:MAG: CBS domain-containing protein [Bacteroidota bacterium]